MVASPRPLIRFVVLCGLWVLTQAIAMPVEAQTSPGVPPAAAKVLQEIRSTDKELLSVSQADGEFLRLMTVSSHTKRALEIGGAFGYSAIWMGLGLKDTGGTLTSIEYDPARAKIAQENVRRAGLAQVVAIVSGDAFKEFPKLSGEFDLVFLDAWKRDYKRFFDLIFPRLRPGGLFLAHNVVNKRTEMGDFLTAIQQNPAVLTSIVRAGDEGISVTVKR